MKLIAALTILLSFNAYAGLEDDLKTGDFKAANDSAIREFRTASREAQTLISKYERVSKNINFESNELLCKSDQSDTYHHACLLFTVERELVSGKFWQDSVSRLAPELLKIDEAVKSHYEKQIQEKANALAQKIKPEVEAKLAECKPGQSIEELEKAKSCIQAVGKAYVGPIFTNSLYQKHVAAGPVYAILSPRLETTEKTLAAALEKWQASPEGQLQKSALYLCNAHSGKQINERAISEEKEIGRSTGFVDARHLYRSGSFLKDSKRTIATYSPKFQKLKGRKFDPKKDCSEFERANEEEH